MWCSEREVRSSFCTAHNRCQLGLILVHLLINDNICESITTLYSIAWQSISLCTRRPLRLTVACQKTSSCGAVSGKLLFGVLHPVPIGFQLAGECTLCFWALGLAPVAVATSPDSPVTNAVLLSSYIAERPKFFVVDFFRRDYRGKTNNAMPPCLPCPARVRDCFLVRGKSKRWSVTIWKS